MKTSWAIDWLAYNALNTYDLNHQSMAYKAELFKWVECKGTFGYDRAVETSDNVRIMWSTTRQDMGTFTSYSGRALTAYRDRDISTDEIMVHHSANGDVCRRLDLAIDVIDSGLSIEKLYTDFKRGRVTTTVKKYNLIAGNNGDTLYIGSRESEQFIRIYDKAKQLGDFLTDRIRIEIELKGSRARLFAKMIERQNELQSARSTQRLINSVVEFHSAKWAEIMGTEIEALAKPKDEQPDTEKWLLQSVAPSMARYIKKTDNRALIVRFIRIVMALVEDGNIDENQ